MNDIDNDNDIEPYRYADLRPVAMPCRVYELRMLIICSAMDW